MGKFIYDRELEKILTGDSKTISNYYKSMIALLHKTNNIYRVKTYIIEDIGQYALEVF